MATLLPLATLAWQRLATLPHLQRLHGNASQRLSGNGNHAFPHLQRSATLATPQFTPLCDHHHHHDDDDDESV